MTVTIDGWNPGSVLKVLRPVHVAAAEGRPVDRRMLVLVRAGLAAWQLANTDGGALAVSGDDAEGDRLALAYREWAEHVHSTIDALEAGDVPAADAAMVTATRALRAALDDTERPDDHGQE